jgi:hypothetical protein
MGVVPAPVFPVTRMNLLEVQRGIMVLAFSTDFDAFVEAINQSTGILSFDWKIDADPKRNIVENAVKNSGRDEIEQNLEKPAADKKETEIAPCPAPEFVKKKYGDGQAEPDRSKEKPAEAPLLQNNADLKKDRKSIEDKIVDILKSAGNGISNLHIMPDIPNQKEFNARKKCKIPKNETIIALLDLTQRRSAKNCLVFGKQGIYFHNPIFSKGQRKGFIPYKSFEILDFSLYGRYEISFGRYYLNVSVLGRIGKERRKIVEILTRVKKEFVKDNS